MWVAGLILLRRLISAASTISSSLLSVCLYLRDFPPNFANALIFGLVFSMLLKFDLAGCEQLTFAFLTCSSPSTKQLMLGACCCTDGLTCGLYSCRMLAWNGRTVLSYTFSNRKPSSERKNYDVYFGLFSSMLLM